MTEMTSWNLTCLTSSHTGQTGWMWKSQRANWQVTHCHDHLLLPRTCFLPDFCHPSLSWRVSHAQCCPFPALTIVHPTHYCTSLVFWHLRFLFFSVSNPTFSYPFYIYLFSFFEQGLMNTSILLCSCGWPSVFLSPSPKFWDYRHLPPHSVPVSLNTTHIFTDISPSVLLPALFNICTWRDTSNFTGLKKRNMIFLPLSLPLASRKWSHHSQATQGKGLMLPGFFPVAF